MPQSLLQWRVSHVRRKANETAHRLANSALLVIDEVIHIEEAPQCASDIVMSEHIVQNIHQ